MARAAVGRCWIACIAHRKGIALCIGQAQQGARGYIIAGMSGVSMRTDIVAARRAGVGDETEQWIGTHGMPYEADTLSD